MVMRALWSIAGNKLVSKAALLSYENTNYDEFTVANAVCNFVTMTKYKPVL
jgi:hypothetical protein